MRSDVPSGYGQSSFGIEVLANTFDHLERSRLFRDVGRDVLERLAPEFRLEHVAVGELAECCEAKVAIIRRGRFHLEFRVGQTARIVTTRLEPGDVLGIETVFGAPCAPSRAETDGIILSVSATVLRAECFRSSDIARNVAESLSSRLNEIAAALFDLRYAAAARRVLAALGKLSKEFGVSIGDGVFLDIALADDDISTIAGCDASDTPAALRLLEREGFLRRSGTAIVLLADDERSQSSPLSVIERLGIV